MKLMKLITINLFVFLILFEILLRIFWSSPYVQNFKGAYFHDPHLDLKFQNIEKLYDYDRDIKFRTGKYGEILGSKSVNKTNLYAFALGGSSTESALVPEGKRWPDLLSIPTYNFGKSRLNSSHTLANLKYILNNYDLKPKIIFVMDGVNNLSNYIKWGVDGLSSPNYFDDKSLYKFILKNYYTSAFFFSLVKRSDYFLFYKLDVDRRKTMTLISNIELEEYLIENQTEITKSLKEIYGKIRDVGVKNGIEVIILTQPNSYSKDYKVHNYDLRVTPIIKNKALTIDQARMVSNQHNEITMNVANNLNLRVIDVAKCFQNEDPSKLLYDSHHLTIEGSIHLAECINNQL